MSRGGLSVCIGLYTMGDLALKSCQHMKRWYADNQLDCADKALLV